MQAPLSQIRAGEVLKHSRRSMKSTKLRTCLELLSLGCNLTKMDRDSCYSRDLTRTIVRKPRRSPWFTLGSAAGAVTLGVGVLACDSSFLTASGERVKSCSRSGFPSFFISNFRIFEQGGGIQLIQFSILLLSSILCIDISTLQKLWN